MTMTMTMTMTTMIDPLPDRSAFGDRTDAVRLLAEAARWTVLDIRLSSFDARGETFVTGHIVDVVDENGQAAQHTVFLDTASDHPGTVPLESADGERLSAWLYPADPALPALAPAVYPDTVRVILERLGLESTAVALDLLSYRPGKRAVLRTTTTTRTWYLKIVRPDRVEAICSRHSLWREEGVPAPDVVSWSPDGLMVLAPLPGSEAVGMLDELGDPTGLVSAVAALAGRVALIPSDHPARPSLALRLDWYRDRLTQFAAGSEPLISEICDAIARRLASSAPNPRAVTVHGDLHLGQIFVDPGDRSRIVGVLDIDTAGLGDPADDAAALVAHLIASAELTDRAGRTERAARTRAVARAFQSSWTRAGDPGFEGRARAIAATHLLGHCLSGSLGADRCLALASEMLLHESALTPVSLPSHGPAEPWEQVAGSDHQEDRSDG